MAYKRLSNRTFNSARRHVILKEFTLSGGKKLKISEDALNHIVKGDFAIRPLKDQKNMEVLSGGLHTYDGWIDFKNKYPNELEHLHNYNSELHKYWYYARELSNGVITLRLPKELFTGKASKITLCPDDYYTSGYLWKTLFPKGYDASKILESIEEAILNEDKEQSKKGQIVGYINKSSPLETIKIIILYRGGTINSVYPAWTQPNSGNNGKPYSHYENIGFIVSQSTEYFDDEISRPPHKFTGAEFTSEELPRNTPALFTSRDIPDNSETPVIWAERRIEELKSIKLNDAENDSIFKYLNDFCLVKYYPEITSGAYAHIYSDLKSDHERYNSFQIVQNFIDGLNYLHLKGQLTRLISTIEYLLKNMISHTLYDLLAKKRILSTMLNIVVKENNAELSYKFIAALSKSPIKREVYLEYNLDSLHKKKITVPTEDLPEELYSIINPSLDFNLCLNDYVEILKETIGETYTLNFTDDQIDIMLEEIISNQEVNFDKLVSDSISYLSRDEFTSLSDCIETILNSAIKYEDAESLSIHTGLILRDYCRIQFAHRLKINARYIMYHDYSHPDEFYLPFDKNLLLGTVLKHERIINNIKLESFTDGIISYSKAAFDKNLENDTNNFIKKIGQEVPPLPEKIT